MNPSGHAIDVPQADLDDLRSRLRRTRCPVPWPGAGWEAGTDAGELRRLPGPLKRVTVPTAVALFPAHLSHPPASWIELTYNLVRYTRMPGAATSRRMRNPGCWGTTSRSSSGRSAELRAGGGRTGGTGSMKRAVVRPRAAAPGHRPAGARPGCAWRRRRERRGTP